MANTNPPAWATELNQKLDRVIELLEAAPAQPQAVHSPQPTFCGYRCSWDIDDAGWPSYIHIEDGTMAMLRTGEKAGPITGTVPSLGRRPVRRSLSQIPAGSTPPDSLLVMPAAVDAPPQADEPPAPADHDTPFDQADESRLRIMHQIGRAVHGDELADTRPRSHHRPK